MTQAFHLSLGNPCWLHWEGRTGPCGSYWRTNDTLSSRKTRGNGPRWEPNQHLCELIFKSISLIAWKSMTRQIVSELGLLHQKNPHFPAFSEEGQRCPCHEEASASQLHDIFSPNTCRWLRSCLHYSPPCFSHKRAHTQDLIWEITFT